MNVAPDSESAKRMRTHLTTRHSLALPLRHRVRNAWRETEWFQPLVVGLALLAALILGLTGLLLL